MKPSQAIEPEVSFTVVLRLRPVAARADVSPIVSVADTRNINVTEIIALILNSGLNGIIIEVIISLLIISTASLIIVVGFVTALNLFTDSNHYKDVTNKQQKALVDEENKDTDIDVNDTLANYSITVNESGNQIIVNGTYKKATSKTYKDVNLSNFIAAPANDKNIPTKGFFFIFIKIIAK